MKFAGYDLILLEGRAANPSYLLIEDDAISFESAEPIWGESVWKTEDWIRNQHNNPKLRIASIGVAGERGVRYAAVINDLHRAAGRSGVGAVIASKAGLPKHTEVPPGEVWGGIPAKCIRRADGSKPE